MINVIFIHGVGDKKEKYSNDLFENIVKKYKENTGMKRKEINRKIRHCEILWDNVIEDIMKKYYRYQYGPKIKSPYGLLLKYFKVDSLVVQILYYLKDKENKKGGGRSILDKINNQFKEFHKDDVKEDIIIAHSLGSVIAFDYVFRFEEEENYRYDTRCNIKALITLGSPIPIFTTAMNHSRSELKKPRHIKKWINILDKDDGVARYCQPHFREKIVKDVEVDIARGIFSPFTGHTRYWGDEKVAEIIANEL